MRDAAVGDVQRAVAAATSVALSVGLAVDEAILLHASNRLALRLLPSDVVARVAPGIDTAAQFEVDLATRLAGTASRVAPLDPRVPARVYERDGYVITLWTYFAAQPSRDLSPGDYAAALVSLHRGLQRVDVRAPHFTDRVRQAEHLVSNGTGIPDLSDTDRRLLADTLQALTRAISERRAPEHLLHGEPHPGNVLNTATGPLFIDLETCCRGPVEFDLAHTPAEVSERYPDADQALVRQCRVLVLAMAAAWRLDPTDRFPGGRQAFGEILNALRSGPPYPALGAITGLE
jgi:aminoglycoside phosphotransferase (APT) family kinase protein